MKTTLLLLAAVAALALPSCAVLDVVEGVQFATSSDPNTGERTYGGGGVTFRKPTTGKSVVTAQK